MSRRRCSSDGSAEASLMPAADVSPKYSATAQASLVPGEASPVPARDMSHELVTTGQRSLRRRATCQPSPEASGPVAEALGDASLAAARLLCRWCGGAVAESSSTGRSRRADAEFCSKPCRQAAFRLRRLGIGETTRSPSRRFAYADPPYPGFAYLYRNEESYGGEVDHRELVGRLVENYDGWALSTHAHTLQEVLALCPKGVRVHPWVKPIGVSSKTFGAHNTWEPIIVCNPRRLRPGFRDWLSAVPAKGGGTLIGRKPLAFCVFLFRLLGVLGQDSFDDLFPGTGIVTRALQEYRAGGVAARAATGCE